MTADAPSGAHLELGDVRAWYGSVQALFGISFAIERGRSVALVGTNGAGKTSTVRSILGLVRTQGAVRIDGELVSSLPCHRRCRQHRVAVVHEGRGLFYELSVLDNIRLHARAIPPSVIADVLDLFPALHGRLTMPVGMLSGGEQQMVAIARVLAARPSIVLLDEPGLGLSPRLVTEMYRHLEEIKRLGATILLVEQSIERALSFVDSVVVLAAGRVVDEIPAQRSGARSLVEQLVLSGKGAQPAVSPIEENP